MTQTLDNKTIYEIFRACRLCGAGGGYKMPIIPTSVVGFNCEDIELRQKIRECVQIEVNQDDKMPPLICELCVDKVNDFFEFLEMCRQTNKKTRQRLGLPLLTQASEAEECVLGVTEPVWLAAKGDNEPQKKKIQRPVINQKQVKSKKQEKGKEYDRLSGLRKELESLVKSENEECVLGGTQPVWLAAKIDIEPQKKIQRPNINQKGVKSKEQEKSKEYGRLSGLRKELESLVKDESSRQSRTSRGDLQSSDSSRRSSRSSLATSRDNSVVLQLHNLEDDDDAPLATRNKRTRDRETDSDASDKRLKLTHKPPLDTGPTVNVGPKSYRQPSPPPPSRNYSVKEAQTSKTVKKKRNPTLSPTPGQSKRIPSSAPGPKSKKRLSSPPRTQYTSKTSRSPSPKRQTSPHPKRIGPKSKTRETSPNETLKSLDKKHSAPFKLAKNNQDVPSTNKIKSKTKAPNTVMDCLVCGSVFQTPQGHANHMKVHTVRQTPKELACDPCGEWFSTAEAALAHHKSHSSRRQPYRCRGCAFDYHTHHAYRQHIADTGCVPYTELPDLKCEQCWRGFPTRPLLDSHRCGGVDSRPGGKCPNCKRVYMTLKGLTKHVCTKRKGPEDILSRVKIDPRVRKRLLVASVRTRRCDQLLAGGTTCDAAAVPENFGLDPSCVYPYRSIVHIKQEPLAYNSMVSIGKDITADFYVEEDYVHWDSDDCSDSDEEYFTSKKPKMSSLTALTLKTLFSRQCLGKVPKKLRKAKPKFDMFFNTENDFDVQDDVNNIINSLGDDENSNTNFQELKLSDVRSISEVTDADSFVLDVNEVNNVTNSIEVSNLNVNENDNDSNVEASDNTAGKIEEKDADDVNQDINDYVDNDSKTDCNDVSNTNVDNDGKTDCNDVRNTNVDNDAETDASDEHTQEIVNIVTNGTSQNANHDETNRDEHENERIENGNVETNFEEENVDSAEIRNGVNAMQLINELSALCDDNNDKLMEKIGDKESDVEKEKMSIDDLVPKSDGSFGLLTDEFNFDN